jgi:hypothetical protein
MYARVVTVHVQPGKMDAFLRRLRELAPAAKARRGFHEARFLTDAPTGTVLGITVWETEADAKAAPVGGSLGSADPPRGIQRGFHWAGDTRVWCPAVMKYLREGRSAWESCA